MRDLANRPATTEAGCDTECARGTHQVPTRTSSRFLPRSMGGNGIDTPETGLAVGHRVGRLAEQRELAFILQVAPNLWRQAIAPRGAGAFVSRTRDRQSTRLNSSHQIISY